MIRERDRPAPSTVFVVDYGSDFSFDRFDYGGDQLRKVFEYFDRVFFTEESGLVHHYVNGDLNLHVEVLDDAGRHVGKLFFCGVPLGLRMLDVKITDVTLLEANSCVGHSHWGESAVYLLVSDLVEGVKKPIPSLVWFEPFDEEGLHVGRNDRLFPTDIFRSLFLGGAERELCVLRCVNAGDSADTIVHGMIQGGTEVPDYVKGDRTQLFWNWFFYSRLKEGLPCPPVNLSEHGVRMAVAESVSDGFKFGNVLSSARQQ